MRYTVLRKVRAEYDVKLDEGLDLVGVVDDVHNPCCKGRPVVIGREKGSGLYQARCSCGRFGTEYAYQTPVDALNAFEGELPF